MNRTFFIFVSGLLKVALACTAANADTPHAARGIASHIDVSYPAPLVAKSSLTNTSPVLVRVSPGPTTGSYRIEFIGAAAGSFDLRDSIQREDGRAADDLPPIPVVIDSHLPIDHGTDLYSTADSSFNWRNYYREILLGLVAAWLAVPVVVYVRRALRRQPPPVPVAPPRVPTVEDELREALAASRERPLTTAERGRLELLLFRLLSARAAPPTADADAVAAAIRAAREDPATAPLVLAIERWLHTRDPDEAARSTAAAALEDFRRAHLAAAIHEPAGVPA